MADAEQRPDAVTAPRRRLPAAALVALVLLSGVWAWWAWQEGAYFPSVVLPGTVVLCLGAALLIGSRRGASTCAPRRP